MTEYLTLAGALYAVIIIILVAFFVASTAIFGEMIKDNTNANSLSWDVWLICMAAATPVTGMVVKLLMNGLEWLAGTPL